MKQLPDKIAFVIVALIMVLIGLLTASLVALL